MGYKAKALRAAECFHQVAQEMVPDDWIDDDNDDGHWFIPSVVNLAFACELYLKALLSDGNSEVRGHEWDILFSKLPDRLKRAVMKTPEFNEDVEFCSKLKAGGEIFKEWRYYFEQKEKPLVDLIFLENFAIVLHTIAKSECG